MAGIVSSLVEVAVFRFLGDRPEYLLLQRAENETLYPGLWQLITGGTEGGERAVDAALREVREETGLAPSQFWCVPGADVFFDVRSDTMQLAAVFAAEVGIRAEVRLSKEHQACLWLPFSEAVKRLVWPGQRSMLELVHRTIAGGEAAAGYSALPPGGLQV